MGQPLHKISPIKVGVECCIMCQDYILLQKRPNDSIFFPGYLCFPGGHVDYGEDVLTATIREIKEETGIQLVESQMQLILNELHHHSDRDTIWLIYTFKANLKAKVQPVSSSEGEVSWFKISELDKSKIIPPVLKYLDYILSNKSKTKFAFGKYKNDVIIEGVERILG